MLDDFINSYKKVGQAERRDDDVFDRFSHRWTVVLLGIFLVAISGKQLVGVPIECIPPPHFDANQMTYVENYCWIHFTYSIDENSALTRDFVRGANGSRRTPYYIWIPYLFILAALSSYLPAWIWHVIGHRLTFDIPLMLNSISKTNFSDFEDRQTNLFALAKHFHKAQRYSKVEKNFFRKFISICMFCVGGGILTATYFLVKIFYLLNAVGQFFLLNYFLDIDFLSFGQNVIFDLVRSVESKVLFPRIVFCDFTIRYIGDNNPNYTVQCTLPINLYNERFLTVYWFWLIFVILATSFGIFVWLCQMSYRNRRSFLKKHLRLTNEWKSTDENRVLFTRFVDDYLGGDGVLFLRLVSKNTNPLFVGELLLFLWKQFEDERALKNVAVFQVDTFLNGRDR